MSLQELSPTFLALLNKGNAGLSLADLEALSEALLEFTSLADLAGWLASRE